jgi:uncharacterized protein with HEPN domain
VPSSRPATRFLDILDNIRLIQSYLQSMDRAAFEADRRTRVAVGRCLERLSEAATKLGAQADELAPGPPWPAVRAFRNILRHAHDQVDPTRIWEIATGDLPRMAAAEAALQHLDTAQASWRPRAYSAALNGPSWRYSPGRSELLRRPRRFTRSHRPEVRVSSTCGQWAGSSKPSPPATPFPCRSADAHKSWRHVIVTDHRTARDFADCMRDLTDVHYPDAARIRMVMDNLSTHTAGALYEAFPASEAHRVLQRLEFHYTPKHASRLNMVEIEIGVLRGKCLDRRIGERDVLVSEIDAWQRQRNASGARVNWKFTTQKARHKQCTAPKPTSSMPRSRAHSRGRGRRPPSGAGRRAPRGRPSRVPLGPGDASTTIARRGWRRSKSRQMRADSPQTCHDQQCSGVRRDRRAEQLQP